MPSPALLSSVGIVLSLYALYVEHRVSHPAPVDEFGQAEEEFKALCDIEAIGASCSQVFALPEGHMLSYFGLVPPGSLLDVPNPLLGMTYYSYIFLLSVRVLPSSIPLVVTFGMSCLAMASSIFLAYKLMVLKELCIVCWTTHALNSMLLWHFGKRYLDGKEVVGKGGSKEKSV